MEKKFKSLGSTLRKNPSPRAWDSLERQLNKEASSNTYRLITWIAAACFIGLVFMVGTTWQDQSITSTEMQAYHPEFEILEEEISVLSSSGNQEIHKMYNVYKQ